MASSPAPSHLQGTYTNHKGPIHTVVFSGQAATYALSGGQDRTVQLWKPGKEGCIKSYTGHGYEVLGIACAVDNKSFASCGGDKTVFVWDTGTGDCKKRFMGHNSKVNAVALSEDAGVLVSGSTDMSARIWDMKSQQRMPIQILEEAKDSITSVCILGSLIVTGSVDGYVRTYDVRKGELRVDYFEHPVTSITMSKDSTTLLVSSLNSCIRAMDATTGNLFQKFTGHTNESFRSKACFAGGGEGTVVFGDEDGVVRAWELESGKVLSEYKAHEKTILWTAHHPTEKQMLTASADGTVKVWNQS